MKLLLLLPAVTLAFAAPSYAYDASCASRAVKLKSAAETYEGARAEYERNSSGYESASDSFDRACHPDRGYSRNDEGACGPHGYEQSKLESAQRTLETAKSRLDYARLDLERAMGRVSRSCGTDSAADAVRRACGSAMAEIQENLDNCESRLQKLERAE